MPCYTERTITTQLEAAHPDVLARALSAVGLMATLQADGRTVMITGPALQRAVLVRDRQLTANFEADITVIKKAYATEAVRTAARKYGWRVAGEAQDQLTIVRRTL